MKKVLVIGATGMLGEPVTRELLAYGYPVTVFTTNPDKAKQKFGGVAAVQGNLNDLDSLRRAMQGQDAVYLNLSITSKDKPGQWNAENGGMENAVKVAKELSTPRLVYLSSLLMNYQPPGRPRWWVFEEKQAAAKKLKTSGVPYFIFYPSSFMDTLASMALRDKRLAVAGESKVPMYFIAASDYGKMVAKALEQNTPTSREYVVQGRQAYTMDQAVKTFAENYPKAKLPVMKLPFAAMRVLALFNPEARFGVGFMEALNNSPEPFQGTDTWRELGEPKQTLENFARSL